MNSDGQETLAKLQDAYPSVTVTRETWERALGRWKEIRELGGSPQSIRHCLISMAMQEQYPGADWTCGWEDVSRDHGYTSGFLSVSAQDAIKLFMSKVSKSDYSVPEDLITGTFALQWQFCGCEQDTQ